MTRRKFVIRNTLVSTGILFAVFAILESLRFGTAIRDPEFVLMNEAYSEGNQTLVRLRVRLAGALGGRSDVEVGRFGYQSPLEVAADRGNLGFLREAAALSSTEHARKVFDEACSAGRGPVVLVIQETFPSFECARRSGVETTGERH